MVPRAVERGSQREFVWVSLTLSEQEVREGVQAHPACPALLHSWLTKGSGAIRTVAEFEDASTL